MKCHTLVVYAPGLGEPRQRGEDLLSRMTADPGTAGRRLAPWRFGSAARRGTAIADEIQRVWTGLDSPGRVILVGHGAGGLLLRYAYLLARGQLGGAPRTWVTRVGRIALLAVPNRGLEPARLPRLHASLMRLTRALLPGLPFAGLRPGSAFLATLRLTWMHEMEWLGDRAPLTVVLRGGQDHWVHRDDSRDIENGPAGVDLLLPGADHADIIQVDGVPEVYPGQRYAVLRKAILDDSLGRVQSPELYPAEAAHRRVVFLLPGRWARDDSWVRELTELLAQDRSTRVVPVSYGTLSLFPFGLPLTNGQVRDWLADEYAHLRARYPELPFHAVVQGGGAELLARVMRRIEPIEFDRVYVAESPMSGDRLLALVDLLETPMAATVEAVRQRRRQVRPRHQTIGPRRHRFNGRAGRAAIRRSVR
jgi:hypothetical protein